MKDFNARCAECGGKATCFGAYEGETAKSYACDDCCGHGSEDGKCVPIKLSPELELALALLDRVKAGTALLPGAADKWAYLIRGAMNAEIRRVLGDRGVGSTLHSELESD